VKRLKNDAIDAEAICEAALRPNMRQAEIGATSEMGECTLRRLLVIGSSAVLQQASKRGAPKGAWLEQMLARKPRMLVTVALANKMARIAGR
jgi:transposase